MLLGHGVPTRAILTGEVRDRLQGPAYSVLALLLVAVSCSHLTSQCRKNLEGAPQEYNLGKRGALKALRLTLRWHAKAQRPSYQGSSSLIVRFIHLIVQ